MKKLLLAYSGGLVNSVSIHWLKYQRQFRVVTFTADVGQGAPQEDLADFALELGAESAHVTDLKRRFVDEYCFESLRAGAQYEGTYLLAAALSRPLIASELVRLAREEGCRYVGHGCIGKGNDQFRFEASIAALAPDIQIVPTRRMWDFRSIDEVTAYARRHALMIEDETLSSAFSVDRNLWGARISGGPLEDPSVAAPEEVFQITRSPLTAPDAPVEIDIGFDSGTPVSLDGERLSPVDLVERLNRISGEHGIGRSDQVENRIFGMKVREVYEAPAATVLHVAHDQLEKLTLDRESYQFKLQLSQKMADQIYQGAWFSELREAISAFFARIQRVVTGNVRVRLFKGHVMVIARNSPYSLYSRQMATIQQEGEFSTHAVDGFLTFLADTGRKTAKIQRREANRPQLGSHRSAPPPPP